MLLSEGAEIVASIRRMPTRSLYGEKITFVEDAYEAAKGADALVLVTEWRQYQSRTSSALKSTMRKPLLVDGRNIWTTYGLRKAGFIYEGIGARSQ